VKDLYNGFHLSLEVRNHPRFALDVLTYTNNLPIKPKDYTYVDLEDALLNIT